MPERWQKVGRGVDPQKQDRTDAALAMITSREGSAVSFLGAHGELGLVQGFAEAGFDDREEKQVWAKGNHRIGSISCPGSRDQAVRAASHKSKEGLFWGWEHPVGKAAKDLTQVTFASWLHVETT